MVVKAKCKVPGRLSTEQWRLCRLIEPATKTGGIWSVEIHGEGGARVTVPVENIRPDTYNGRD